MTYLGLCFSRYINGVSMRHEEISQSMFPTYPINSITNGVHPVSWVSTSFADLFDREVPEWRKDSNYLRYLIPIPIEEVQKAHAAAKRILLGEIESVPVLSLIRQYLRLALPAEQPAINGLI